MLTTDFTGTYDYEKTEAEAEAEAPKKRTRRRKPRPARTNRNWPTSREAWQSYQRTGAKCWKLQNRWKNSANTSTRKCLIHAFTFNFRAILPIYSLTY